MKIETLMLSKLHNEEHHQFHSDIFKLINKFTASALDIDLVCQPYGVAIGKEDEVLSLIRKSIISEAMSEADRKRLAIYRGLQGIVKANINHFGTDVSQGANRLLVAIEHHGNVPKKNLTKKTDAISSIVAELSGTFAKDVSTVGIADWVKELQARNEEFKALKDDRYSEAAAKTTFHMAEVRQEVNAAYKTIVERVNALVVINGEANYKAFITEINGRIASYSLTISQRNSKSNNQNK